MVHRRACGHKACFVPAQCICTISCPNFKYILCTRVSYVYRNRSQGFVEARVVEVDRPQQAGRRRGKGFGRGGNSRHPGRHHNVGDASALITGVLQLTPVSLVLCGVHDMHRCEPEQSKGVAPRALSVGRSGMKAMVRVFFSLLVGGFAVRRCRFGVCLCLCLCFSRIGLSMPLSLPLSVVCRERHTITVSPGLWIFMVIFLRSGCAVGYVYNGNAQYGMERRLTTVPSESICSICFTLSPDGTWKVGDAPKWWVLGDSHITASGLMSVQSCAACVALD